MAEKEMVVSAATESEDPFFAGSTLADLEKEARDAEENPDPKKDESKEPEEKKPDSKKAESEEPEAKEPEVKTADGKEADGEEAGAGEELEADEEASENLRAAIDRLTEKNKKLSSDIGREVSRRGDAEKRLGNLEEQQKNLVALLEKNPAKLKKFQAMISELTDDSSASASKKDADDIVDDIVNLEDDGLSELADLEDTKPIVNAIRGIRKAFGSKLNSVLDENKALKAKVEELEKSDSSRRSTRMKEEVQEHKWDVLNELHSSYPELDIGKEFTAETLSKAYDDGQIDQNTEIGKKRIQRAMDCAKVYEFYVHGPLRVRGTAREGTYEEPYYASIHTAYRELMELSGKASNLRAHERMKIRKDTAEKINQLSNRSPSLSDISNKEEGDKTKTQEPSNETDAQKWIDALDEGLDREGREMTEEEYKKRNRLMEKFNL